MLVGMSKSCGEAGMSRWAGARHQLMLPPWEEALVHPPTWVRGCGSNYHGREPVTLLMAWEEEPRSSHANMIGAHLEVLLVRWRSAGTCWARRRRRRRSGGRSG